MQHVPHIQPQVHVGLSDEVISVGMVDVKQQPNNRANESTDTRRQAKKTLVKHVKTATTRDNGQFSTPVSIIPEAAPTSPKSALALGGADETETPRSNAESPVSDDEQDDNKAGNNGIDDDAQSCGSSSHDDEDDIFGAEL
jgi:hypothetical protein